MKLRVLVVIVSIIFVTGCGGPARVKVPKIKASQASAEAMKTYDSDGDGFLDAKELDACPAIREAMRSTDTDGDGKISGDEITNRLKAMMDSKAGSLPASCMVTLDGRPIDNAEIRFDPEPFLGGAVSAARGATDYMGICDVISESLNSGAQIGFYKVRISLMKDGTEQIPAKYNTETILGAEVSLESKGLQNGRFQFQLRK